MHTSTLPKLASAHTITSAAMVAYSADSVNVVVVVVVTAKSSTLAIVKPNIPNLIALAKLCFHTMVNLGCFLDDVLANHE